MLKINMLEIDIKMLMADMKNFDIVPRMAVK